MKKIRVAAAVIQDSRGRFLCMQRCRSDQEYTSQRWEFPGGKIEDGESGYDALLREIKEEMDWDIFVGRLLGTITYEYPDFTISLEAYLCKGGKGQFKLLEHLDYKWLKRSEMSALDWTEADREVLALLP
jgi:8-oxo-dGTP diphosphatase